MSHSPLNSLEQVAALLSEHGVRLYGGEAISQLEHALQAALAAEQDGASDALITAAFLHDLGHLVCEQGDDDVANGINDHHEAVATQVLRSLFADDVLQPIALHVAAKRYLCSIEPGYHASLSDASRASLALQGGAMDAAACARFARHPHAADALRLRRYDEQAKTPGLVTPPLAHYLAIAARAIQAAQA